MSQTQAQPLVADIGGTHIRLALVHHPDNTPLAASNIKLLHISKKRCRDYPSPIEAIQEYLALHQCQATTMCLAVAGPINQGKVNLTNHHWSFSQQQLQQAFDIEAIRIINDFRAQAMAVPFIQPNKLLCIGHHAMQENNQAVSKRAPNLIIGPGTGLGVASLMYTKQGWHAVPGEGGHVDFAPRTALDHHVLEYLLTHQQFTRVSAEDLLSGRGIERLYLAHTWLHTQKHGNGVTDDDNYVTDKVIIQRALERKDTLCMGVLHHFCEILGGVAGNAALTLGARGGVYIAGGLIPRFPDIFKNSRFRQAFEDKAPMDAYMKAIPTYAVLAEQPGLLGAAAMLMQN